MRHKHSRQEEPIEIKLYKRAKTRNTHQSTKRMANNNANMGWGDVDDAPRTATRTTRAPVPRPRTVRTAVARELEENSRRRR